MHERGVERISLFSDAVVAIALTLLVLPLVELGPELQEAGSVAELLSANQDKLFSFVLSFVVIARYWVGHQRLFRHVVAYDQPLVWANFLWLLGIVFLPFPTELIGSEGSDTTGAALYIATLLITNVALAIEVWMLRRKPALRGADAGPLDPIPAFATMIALVIALVLAAAVPGVGLWSLLILIPASFVHGPRPKP